ncbi:MAG: hypothetical protein KA271_03335 [Propionivibrio sp.]|nr:hypothetical protein [Propionivibrio sp.]
MTNYANKTYGRNTEVATLFAMLKAGKDVSQHGPRRLGKSFVLDRMVEQAKAHGFICLKVEIAGCTEPKMVFRRLCEEITNHRTIGKKAISLLTQRLSQLASPRGEQAGPWYQPLLGVDWETYLERLLGALQDDPAQKWAILIDELPIFLKSLHDKGDDGIKQARDFMNLFTRLRAAKPRVRWLITGSIGITPLAQAGQYMGVLSKFQNFELEPLTDEQAVDYLRDLALSGLIQRRTVITKQEAHTIIEMVGWRAAYYLEALAQHLPASPETEPEKVQANLDTALAGLLKHNNKSTFGTWEEHLNKHHSGQQRRMSFDVLNKIAASEGGLTLDNLLGALGDPLIDREHLRQHLLLLISDGFLYQEPMNDDSAPYRFRLTPLRHWWALYRPQAAV